MNTVMNLLSLIGSLGLFLYGMKIMSEGLEKFAGNQMRSILKSMTKNRFFGVLTGILITALIQSSSASTVMVVSFVNAGLMSLTQAIGVIMGANIGTTITAWVISAIGFKVNIVVFALPLLAVGLPLMFSKKSNRKYIGEFIFGFSFRSKDHRFSCQYGRRKLSHHHTVCLYWYISYYTCSGISCDNGHNDDAF